jgi:D-glycero-alpha-D-manno-heptose-7-phosphate kinase
MRRLVARAPTRIDFGGGWTDVPPYPARYEGFVCNAAIDRYAIVAVENGRDDGTVPLVSAAFQRAGVADARVALTSDFPVGAGLGGSSAAGVALAGALAAWRGERLDRVELAELSCTTERNDLGVAGGSQDHYAAAFGGVLALRFRESAIDVQEIVLAPALRAELARRCIVWFTGESRISAQQIEVVVDSMRDGDERVLRLLAGMKRCAIGIAEALHTAALDDLGKLVGEHWELQRALHPSITTDTIEAMCERAYANGALGFKALGASGGGCVLAVARADRVDALRDAMRDLAEPLPFALDGTGFSVVEDGRD